MRDFKGFVRAHLPPLDLPRRRELTIVDELSAQLEDAYESLRARGLSDEDAWAALLRDMPDWKAIGEALLDAEPALVRLTQPPAAVPAGARRSFVAAVRAVLTVGVARDLRSGVRSLVSARGFTATTILTLAICLGANVAIFTVVHAVLLRPLPVPDADRLVTFGDVYPTITPDDILSNTAPSYFDRLGALPALEEQALFSFWFDTIAIDGVPQELRGMRATPSLFRLLGVPPAIGRTFRETEGEVGADRAVVLSHGLWQQLYGGDPGVLGRSLRLGWTGESYTIIGVMPRGFVFFDTGDDGHARAPGDPIQFWLPLAFTPAQRSDDARTRYGFFHIGRLGAGATIEQVQAQVDALNARVAERYPQLGFAELGMYTAVTPLPQALTRNVRGMLYLLWGGAAFVLLIGGLNIANLSLARAQARARPLAIQLALGATRLRLARQLTLESVLLSVAGGAGGLAVGAALLRLVFSSDAASLPHAASLHVDAIVIGVTVVFSVLVGITIGLATASSLRRPDLDLVLADGSRGGTGGIQARLLRRALVVTQVAVSLVLLIGAIVLLMSFRHLMSIDAGFDRERVLTATLFPPPSRYADQPAVVALADRILEAVRALPGVEAAGITSNIALSGRPSPATVRAADRIPVPGEPPLLPYVVAVSPGYFAAMSATLVRGRLFTDRDQPRSQPVAIVDERLAARLWPGKDPLGEGLFRGDSVRYTVIGVVRDVRLDGLAARSDAVGTAYFPHTQAPSLGRLRWIAVRTAGDPATMLAPMRAAVTAIDSDLPLSDVQTMDQRTVRSLAAQQLAMKLATMFSAIAMLLSVVGIYGVLAYLVTRRTREFGIRLALGSSVRSIFALVFREGAMLVGSGLGLGLLGAVALSRVLREQVHGIDPADPRILALVASTTGAIALLACVRPARRATRVAPASVLSDQ
jgi:predicted permease